MAGVAVRTYCQSFLMWPFCRSLLRKATWQVLQVYGWDADMSCAGGAARLPVTVAIWTVSNGCFTENGGVLCDGLGRSRVSRVLQVLCLRCLLP